MITFCNVESAHTHSKHVPHDALQCKKTHLCRTETTQECLEESAPLHYTALPSCTSTKLSAEGRGTSSSSRVGRRRKCWRNVVSNHRILSFRFQFGFSFWILFLVLFFISLVSLSSEDKLSIKFTTSHTHWLLLSIITHSFIIIREVLILTLSIFIAL